MVCVVGNKSRDIGMGIRERIMVSFLPYFDAFCEVHPYMTFRF